MICPVYKDKPLVGAGEWTLASVVHNVELEEDFGGKRTEAAGMGAGIARRHSRMLRCDMPLELMR